MPVPKNSVPEATDKTTNEVPDQMSSTPSKSSKGLMDLKVTSKDPIANKQAITIKDHASDFCPNDNMFLSKQDDFDECNFCHARFAIKKRKVLYKRELKKSKQKKIEKFLKMEHFAHQDPTIPKKILFCVRCKKKTIHVVIFNIFDENSITKCCSKDCFYTTKKFL